MGRPKLIRINRKCEICDSEFECKESSKKLTCSKHCSNKLAYKRGRKVIKNKESNYSRWLRLYGKEEADLRQEKSLKNISSGLLKNLRIEQRKIARKNITEWNKKQKGKTLEEIHGLEKSQKIRENLSNKRRGKNNPAFGKIYLHGGRSVRGNYKGKFFRSILELSFMKSLEERGVNLDDIQVETWKVPYTFEGINRTYTPDFYCPNNSIVWECKMSWAKDFKENPSKFRAAKDFFDNLKIKFIVITEKDIHKLSFEEAIKFPDIVWEVNTFQYFRK